MNESFEMFQDINESIQQLLSNEYHFINSIEIQKSAQDLQESMQPCLQEIKLSANRLKDLMQVCFQDLDQAEDVWQSKQKISETSQKEIWEQLGELTGCHVKVTQLGEKYKIEIIKFNEDLLDKAFEEIRQQYFIDPKSKQQRQAVGWGDKDAFNKGITPKIKDYSEQFYKILFEKVSLLYKNLALMLISKLYAYTKICDKKSRSSIKIKIESLNKLIKEDLNCSKDLLNNIQERYTINILSFATFYFDSWQKKIGDITWKEVMDFKEKILYQSNDIINMTFSDRIITIQETLEIGIQFYNDFLEKQARYQQETPEQYLSEKEWIEQQRQTLKNVQMNLEKVA